MGPGVGGGVSFLGPCSKGETVLGLMACKWSG